ncbi:MAG: FAD-dependent oxidoreductase [Rhodanobacter sp.]
MQHTPVLIIGGSLVGLSAALFLGWRDVPVIIIEKHHGSSPHPRATGFTERTLEHFRVVGIADQIPQVDAGVRLRRVTAESLAGNWHEEMPWTPGDDRAFGEKASPCNGAAIAQDKLEPMLRRAALKHGADLRLGTEVLSFEQDADGVIAHIRDRDTGEQYAIHADYMIAADGADSPIRETLGIARSGVGHLRTLRSVLFRCPEAETYLDRGVQQFQIEQPDFKGFLTSYGDGRWVLMFDDDRERSAAELNDTVRTALGREMAFEPLATGRWEMAGRIAERYADGRVFLAGDAAHQLPPTRGGFGANTGIDDAWTLAWKLEWVLNGWSNARLLDSYDAERQPIGWLRHQQTFARPDYARSAGHTLKSEPLFGNEAMELGQLSRSSIILGAGPDLPAAARPSEWAGQPGTRAPHQWLERNGQTLSTIDLFGRNFVLFSQEPRWISATKDAATELGISVETIQIGQDLAPSDPASFAQHFGISAEGAFLVRPDGIVAWRSHDISEAPTMTIVNVLHQVAALASNPNQTNNEPPAQLKR